MALGYKARRRWALVILLIGLPLYIIAAVVTVSLFDRPPFLDRTGDLYRAWRGLGDPVQICVQGDRSG